MVHPLSAAFCVKRKIRNAIDTFYGNDYDYIECSAYKITCEKKHKGENQI